MLPPLPCTWVSSLQSPRWSLWIQRAQHRSPGSPELPLVHVSQHLKPTVGATLSLASRWSGHWKSGASLPARCTHQGDSPQPGMAPTCRNPAIAIGFCPPTYSRHMPGSQGICAGLPPHSYCTGNPPGLIGPQPPKLRSAGGCENPRGRAAQGPGRPALWHDAKSIRPAH